MLHELYLEYGDGRTETKIIHTNEGETVTIYPQRDNIVCSGHKPFKYYIPRWRGLTKAIVRFENRYVIMPHGIECHPKTTMDDIVIVDEPVAKPQKIIEEKWEFTSSDGKGKYNVRVDMGKLKCNCMGFFRAKNKDIGCKHCQEVRLTTHYK
jgi:hypothetical protein